MKQPSLKVKFSEIKPWMYSFFHFISSCHTDHNRPTLTWRYGMLYIDEERKFLGQFLFDCQPKYCFLQKKVTTIQLIFGGSHLCHFSTSISILSHHPCYLFQYFKISSPSVSQAKFVLPPIFLFCFLCIFPQSNELKR